LEPLQESLDRRHSVVTVLLEGGQTERVEVRWQARADDARGERLFVLDGAEVGQEAAPGGGDRGAAGQGRVEDRA
tara:strand:- start:74 stop:298 length:225 start_codon:yes stop_codon:yes gene_type:complete